MFLAIFVPAHTQPPGVPPPATNFPWTTSLALPYTAINSRIPISSRAVAERWGAKPSKPSAAPPRQPYRRSRVSRTRRLVDQPRKEGRVTA